MLEVERLTARQGETYIRADMSEDETEGRLLQEGEAPQIPEVKYECKKLEI